MAEITIRSQIDQVIKKYAEVLKQKYSIHSIYLYGSYSKGENHADSDIDLAIVADDLSGDTYEDTIKLMKYRRMVDNRIEPHPFLVSEFNTDNPMAKEVLETGIRII